MLSLDYSLVELKSRRAQLEIQLLALRRRRTPEAAAEIARVEAQLIQLDARIEEAALGDEAENVDGVVVASLRLSAELERAREHILGTLRSLAEPLQEYQELAERQKRLTARIRSATGKDNSYAAYIDTALMRTSDYDAKLELVLETLRRTPVVR